MTPETEDSGRPPEGLEPVLPGVEPTAPDRPVRDGEKPFTVVGIGASAGGLEPLSTLIAALPADIGMAVVVVQHLSPQHESMLAEILDRQTGLGVTQAEHGDQVERGAVYVIPPGKTMIIHDGHLELAPRTQVRGEHRAIDHFLRSPRSRAIVR